MAIRFFFEYNNLIVQLPVNPEQLKITSAGDNKTVKLIALGEINQLHDTKLRTCSIEAFLPKNSNGPYVLTKGEFKAPRFYIEFFNKIRADKKPCRFLVSDTSINMLASIEDFEYWLEAGDDDIHFNISLKEYRSYSVKIGVAISDGVTILRNPQNVAARTKTDFAIGDTVTVTGRYYYTSLGTPPFGTAKNLNGRIDRIVKIAPYPYHISTLEGGPRGWVKKSQLQHS